MIGVLTGTIFSKNQQQIIVMVGGVGYSVFVASSFIERVSPGEKITLYTHTHVREDVLDLFGFIKEKELELFKLIISISGIGPKGALLIVDRGVELVKKAVFDGDILFFTAIPRLGKKNAQKVIIELRSKIGVSGELDVLQKKDRDTQEVVVALRALGYSASEIARIVPKIPATITTVSDRVKYALKTVHKK